MTENLTLEEKACNHDTWRHINRVQQLLAKCVNALVDRMLVHDQSKLAPPEVGPYTTATPKLAGLTYGSPEYKAQLRECGLQTAIDHHYANNPHHPEYRRRQEMWAPVVFDGFDFTGHYEVSNFGDIRSIDRVVDRGGPTGNTRKTGQVLSQEVTPAGYCRVQLQAGTLRKNAFVHRIVASAFIVNEDDKPEVNHKDGDKQNNRSHNLEWATESENAQHAYDTGLKKPAVKYVVTCEELGLTTFGCCEMVKLLHERGYEKASNSGVWNAINKGCKHVGLEFVGTKFETWMNSPVNDMTLLDLVEMICDWKAASERHNDGNIRKSIEINAERFNLSPQLRRILENTVKEMFG